MISWNRKGQKIQIHEMLKGNDFMESQGTKDSDTRNLKASSEVQNCRRKKMVKKWQKNAGGNR